MRDAGRFGVVVLVAVLCSAVAMAEAPVAVSPGHAHQLVQVEGRCQTFLWGVVPDAASYQLVVYRLGEEGSGEEAKPVVRATVPGSATGWTPALGQCLKRGGRYAWSVRAVGGKAASEWSVPNLFQVTSGPTEAQLQEALQVVHEYLEERRTVTDRGQDLERPGPLVGTVTSATSAAAGGPEADTEAPTSAPSGTTPAVPTAPATVSLSTDGALGVGTSTPLADLHIVGGPTLGGLLLAPDAGVNEGSELMLAEDDNGTYGMKLRYDGTSVPNLLEIWGHKEGVDQGPWLTIERDNGRIRAEKWNPDPPCPDSTQRFVDCGNGTVSDSVTGLIWLSTAHCVLAVRQYPAANDWASTLADGQCGLTDGSRRGDWRLPTKEEWEVMVDPTCPDGQPNLVGNGSSGGCYAANPWASDVAASFYWSSTTTGDNTALAWKADLIKGEVTVLTKISNIRTWPVRSGQ